MSILEKITDIAQSKQQQDDKKQKDNILEQIRLFCVQKFGDTFTSNKRNRIKKLIITTKGKDTKKVIERLSDLPFTDDEFAEIVMLIQKYWMEVHLKPKERELQTMLIELLQIFTNQMGGPELATMGKKVGKIFHQRMKEENDELDGQKPIDMLQAIDPKFSLESTNIEGMFLNESQS